MTSSDTGHPTPRVVIVGPCASGKSTLAKGLKSLGYSASICAQEHSEIPHLWNHTSPDMVIALQVDLATTRSRRGDHWPDTIFNEQQRRLQPAMDVAAVVIDTSKHGENATFAKALVAIERWERDSHAT